MPTLRPSPRNLSAGFTGSADCEVRFSSGAGISNNGGSLKACIANALVNHKSNPGTYVEARFMQQTVAVFDQAPAGLVTPQVSQICRLADGASSSAMYLGFVRGQDECLQFCDDLAEPYPNVAQLCLMNLETIKVYQPNQFVRTALPAAVIPMVAKISAELPASLTAGTCQKVHIGFSDRLNQAFSAMGQKISLKTVTYKNNTGGSGFINTFYSTSTCSGINFVSNPAITGSTGMDVYFVVPTGAVSVKFALLSSTPGYFGFEKVVPVN
jgi:hypothetical protein